MSEWRILDWLPEYAVSEHGDLMRLDVRQKKMGSLVRGHLVRGYRLYRLPDGRGGQRYLLAHRLVCEAWHGKPNALHREAAHWDGTRTNNHYSNLRWASPVENNFDRRRHGTQAGDNSSRAVLSWAIVREVRKNFTGAFGEISALARKHGIHRETMRQAIVGGSWKERDHV